ncbi:MAG: WD40 repeat domain-containing protein [Caulobacteraceae bacterium]
MSPKPCSTAAGSRPSPWATAGWRGEDGRSVQAHEGAALCAVAHPSGEGVLSGGDDGRLVWSRSSGAEVLAELKGKWIDAVAASPASGLIAFAAGREAHLRDVADPKFSNTLLHERAAAGLAFDPKGRRLAVATYGGAALWYARIAEQRPQLLKWAGSHIAVAFSPDGRFLVSSMQENQLHGWRLADGADMRMGGYAAKVKSMAFMEKGRLMATSGAQGAVVWPFTGSNGPMGQSAIEIGFLPGAVVTRVAGQADGSHLAAGLDDGRVWIADLKQTGAAMLKAEKGPAISALAMSADGGRIALGRRRGRRGGAGMGRRGPAGLTTTLIGAEHPPWPTRPTTRRRR